MLMVGLHLYCYYILYIIYVIYIMPFGNSHTHFKRDPFFLENEKLIQSMAPWLTGEK